jgi:glycosyltransferase involved in cell wall biosynthesis
MLSDEQKKAVREKYALPQKFILNVGTIEERKNLALIAKAMPHIISDVNLVVVGKQKKYYKQVHKFLKANKLADKVLFLDKIDFADLPAIYQLAELFIYPSRYEGFGIPILEALNCGTPVIAAKGSCLEEAGGPGSIYVGTDDEVDLAFQINTLLLDADMRAKMVEKGHHHAKNFDDAKLAAQLNKIYTHA